MRLFLHILPNSLQQWKTNEDWCTINNDSLVPNWTASANSSMVKIEGDALCPWKIIFILFRDPLLWWKRDITDTIKHIQVFFFVLISRNLRTKYGFTYSKHTGVPN